MSVGRRARWVTLLDLIDQHSHLDTLNRSAVDQYIALTDAPWKVMLLGAPQCRRMSQDLGDMFRARLILRHTTGIGDGLSAQGFPRWVWSYQNTSPRATNEDLDRAMRMRTWLLRTRRKRR